MNKYLTIFKNINTKKNYLINLGIKVKKKINYKGKTYRYVEIDYYKKKNKFFKKSSNLNNFIKKLRNGRDLNPLPLE